MTGNKRFSINLEYVFIMVFIGVLLWIGVGEVYRHIIVHGYPHGYFAADAFWGQNHVTTVYETGKTLYLPYYIAGGYKDVITHHYPLILQLVALFAHASGLQPYDALFLFGCMLIIMTALSMYVLIRELNKDVAIISTSVMAMIFTGVFMLVITWGKYGSITGNFFLITSFWVMTRFDLKKVWILFGLVLAGVFLGHPSETMFSTAFIAIFLGTKFMLKQLKLHDIKVVLLSGILALILSSHFFYIMSFTELKFRKSEYPTFSPILTQPYPYPVLKDFGIVFLGLIVVGIIFSVLLIIQKRKIEIPIAAGFFLLLLTYSNYIGLFRAFQLRYHWPIYLSIFVGMGAYQLMKLFVKKWSYIHSIGVAGLLIVMFIVTAYKPIGSSGIATPDSWNAFMWIRHNAKPDAQVLFLYGDAYNQESYDFNTHRVGYRVAEPDYFGALQNKTVKRYYTTGILVWDVTKLPYRKSIFKFGYHSLEDKERFGPKVRDICKFDYYIVDKVTRQPIIGQYNIEVAKQLLKNDWIEEVFAGGRVMVLHNKHPGKDCLPEEGVRIWEE